MLFEVINLIYNIYKFAVAIDFEEMKAISSFSVISVEQNNKWLKGNNNVWYFDTLLAVKVYWFTDIFTFLPCSFFRNLKVFWYQLKMFYKVFGIMFQKLLV